MRRTCEAATPEPCQPDATLEVGNPASVFTGNFLRTVKGLAGYWVVLLSRAICQDPAGSSLAHPIAFEVAAFRPAKTLSTRFS